MTKLKNTKKGMAKKALSVSLVAAMLATSNVPVWAAEDLFSDGSATLEVPVVTEPESDAALFSSGETDAIAPAEETSSANSSMILSEGEDTNCDGITIKSGINDDGYLDITGEIKKSNGENLQKFDWELLDSNGNRIDGAEKVNSTNGVDIHIDKLSSGYYTVRFSRNYENYRFEHIFDPVYVVNAANEINNTTFEWSVNGNPITEGAAWDAGNLNLKVTLPFISVGEATKVEIREDDGSNEGKLLEEGTIAAGETSTNVTMRLSKGDIGKKVYAKVTYKTFSSNTKAKSIEITDSYPIPEGTVRTRVTDGTDAPRPGKQIEALVNELSVPNYPDFSNYKYQWLYRDSNGNWQRLGHASAAEKIYTIQTDDYGREICVAVYTGGVYSLDKCKLSSPVKVVAADVDDAEENDFNVTVKLGQNSFAFDPTDLEKNKHEEAITVTYKGKPLTYVDDYNLEFIGYDQVGTVTVVVTIKPTENTDYYSGKLSKTVTYELTVNEGIRNDDYTLVANKSSEEYNGKVIKPDVKVTYDKVGDGKEEITLSADQYTVYNIGPDAKTYVVNAYVKGVAFAGNTINYEITPKNINNHETDFNVVIPDAVWATEDAEDVANNDVAGAKIQIFDTAISETNDILVSEAGKTGGEDNYTIKALNWGEGGVKKSIRITFKHGNYEGSLTIYGEVNSRSIAQFSDQFEEQIKNEGDDYTYNGRLQDALGALISGNTPIVLKDGTKLYEGRDFEYQIVKGGTDAGEVSYYIEGKGNYDGNMTLTNVYKIDQAVFAEAGGDVYDNTDNNFYDFSISYDPSLGDAGANISNYTEEAKNLLELKMVDKDYKLTLGKDYWLDEVNVQDRYRLLSYVPTVAESTTEGHGKNSNFKDEGADRRPVRVYLDEKSLNDSDIQVTIESAEFNGGDLVTPKVKVAYVKDGKEYIINPAYYEVRVVKSAYNQGETGTINIVAKQDNTNNWDSQKYPQLYTGNQMVDYTVGTTNLALGKIVATNGLETLPSVAYDAAQAATETGITLDASKYVVKDSSGNIVDPKYYTVSFSDNKAVGTATITVTGKAPYEGSTSATFTITQNNLPSGTLTLMSNDLSKVYTGEEVELVKGTDYNITGELANLTEGTDYMIVYEDNINVTDATNKAAIKVVGINNYAGEVVKYFDITPATITAEEITLGEAVYQGGVAVRPEVTVGIPGGEATLTEGTDYTVTYLTPATDAGDEGTVQITYTANKNINTADSVKEVKYTVTAKDLKDVTIQAIPDQEATGEQLRPEITVLNGSVRMVEGRDYTVTYGTNTEVGTGTVTITPVDGNANYTGIQEASFNIIEAVPAVGQAVISNIRVSGNTVTPILSGDVDGAVGYDYVLSTSADVTDTASRVDISKNILDTNTSFYYVETGTYYVYCHAWMRDENGLKVFGDWSNAIEVQVNAVTPERPMIQSAKLKGRNLTVTWSRSADATGYDIVMGKAARKVNGEMRPVDYGKAVKKITNGDTVTVTFKSIPKGTYYVGLHAWNRSSESKTKVFSPWSNGRKIVVK